MATATRTAHNRTHALIDDLRAWAARRLVRLARDITGDYTYPPCSCND